MTYTVLGPAGRMQPPYGSFAGKPAGQSYEFGVSGSGVINAFPFNGVVYPYAPVTQRTK